VIFPEDADLAVRVAESVAIEEEAKFRCEGDRNDDRRRQLSVCLLVYGRVGPEINWSYMEFARGFATIVA